MSQVWWPLLIYALTLGGVYSISTVELSPRLLEDLPGTRSSYLGQYGFISHKIWTIRFLTMYVVSLNPSIRCSYVDKLIR
jgi:hypothetical protein